MHFLLASMPECIKLGNCMLSWKVFVLNIKGNLGIKLGTILLFKGGKEEKRRGREKGEEKGEGEG